MSEALNPEQGGPGHDGYLGVSGRFSEELESLAGTVTSEADLLGFLDSIFDDDDFTNWSMPIGDYLDSLLLWLTSEEGRLRMAAYPNDFAAMAAVFYAGISRRRRMPSTV